jgi:hypothetical protein
MLRAARRRYCEAKRRSLPGTPGVDEKADRRTIRAQSAHGRAMVVDPTIPSHQYCAQGYRRTMRRPMLKLCDARVPYP